MREVDCYIAALYRQNFVVKTVESILKNPETLTITITLNKHTDAQFEEACNALAGLNSLYEVPIRIIRGDNAKESNEKLKYIGEGYGKYISFIDNDLILSPNHFNYLIQGCEKYGAYVSLHGVVLHKPPLQSYYAQRDVYRGIKTVLFDMPVDVASNCGSLFKRGFFGNEALSELYDLAPTVGMDDIIMATLCKLNNIPRYVLAHKEGFMRHKVQEVGDDYIFDRYTKQLGVTDKPQTDYVNKYYFGAFK